MNRRNGRKRIAGHLEINEDKRRGRIMKGRGRVEGRNGNEDNREGC